MTRPTLTDIPGIGPARAEILAEHGLGSVTRLARANPGKLASVSGIGTEAMRRYAAAARRLAGERPAAHPPEEQTARTSGRRKAKATKRRRG